MSNETNIRRNAISAIAALAVSTTVILGTVGPVNAGPSHENVQLAANTTDHGQALYA